MQRFVARQNIQHFKEMLAAETDPARRALFERMIAEEEAKLESPNRRSEPEDPSDGR